MFQRNTLPPCSGYLQDTTSESGMSTFHWNIRKQKRKMKASKISVLLDSTPCPLVISDVWEKSAASIFRVDWRLLTFRRTTKPGQLLEDSRFYLILFVSSFSFLSCGGFCLYSLFICFPFCVSLLSFTSVFLSMTLQPIVGPWSLFHFLVLFVQSVVLLGRGMSPS
jgi:hypothetical protein